MDDDSRRTKAVQLILKSLCHETEKEANEEITEIAQQIELAIFDKHLETGSKYSSEIRDRIVSLSNNNFANRLLSGDLTPESYVSMETFELAPENVKEEISRLQQKSLLSSQVATDHSHATDMFQCRNCKKRECVYKMVQTRSADEPMTIFVTCLKCGFVWKTS